MSWHGYFFVENLNMNPSQRSTLVTALQGLGLDNSSSNPAHRNHWRVRNDNEAVIFEALFNEANLTTDAMKQWLGNIFGINPQGISDTVSQTQYGPVATLTYNATNYIRVGVAGGL